MKILTALGLLLAFSLGASFYAGPRGQKPRQVLTGTWEGTGYQTDDNSTWTMRVRAGRRKILIQYPSLNCGGEWKLKRQWARGALFRERLSYGKERCADNGSVLIERLNKNQIIFLYRNAGQKEVTASAILNRTESPDAGGRR